MARAPVSARVGSSPGSGVSTVGTYGVSTPEIILNIVLPKYIPYIGLFRRMEILANLVSVKWVNEILVQ